ncbi:MAG: 2-amino-4-hydroxy-6-hydroxymethyldihydropteridine diphosphokinase [Acidimicrobiales bacterium]
MVRAFLGMGSNVGDRRAILRRAVAAIPELVAVSPVYETDPVGGPEQGPFYNIVVELDTERSPQELLALCHELEQAAGRVRVVRWGPRTLDVDVLLVGDLTVDEENLSVPHARMAERNFVMVPLLDLAPDIGVAGYDPATAIGDVRNVGPL